MRLDYSPFAPFFLYLIEWIGLDCTDTLPSFLGLLHVLVYKVYVDGMPLMSSKERKATLREFYAVIYPSLRQLKGELVELEDTNKRNCQRLTINGKKVEDQRKLFDKDVESDDECGICMESCTKIILPDCGHSMCINCFHDWNARSQSCPFCRGSLTKITSRDLWVLTSNTDVVDTVSLVKENLVRFYLYIENLPLVMPDTHISLFDYML